MHRMRAACHLCGDVNVDAADVEVGGHSSATPSYSFRCPRCGCGIQRPLERPAALLLLAAGARDLDAPDRVGHEAVPTGALDENEVDRFSSLLDCDAAVAASMRRLVAELQD